MKTYNTGEKMCTERARSASAAKGYARQGMATLVVIALTAWVAQGPTPARADALDDAYSDGKLFGAGIPMITWGVLFTTSSLMNIAGDGEMDTEDAISLTTGISQMAAGGILLGIGAAGRPDDSLGRSAFNAGSDVGAGVSMIVYGSLLGLSSVFVLLDILDDSYEDTTLPWITFALSAALSGFQIGYGTYIMRSGQEDFDKVRATGQTGQPMLMMPLLSFGF
jgi:hypothetical protein